MYEEVIECCKTMSISEIDTFDNSYECPHCGRYFIIFRELVGGKEKFTTEEYDLINMGEFGV